ncbi:GPP34 family phosphoprotein [Actinoplanes sp. NPDC051494]|uniref:GOLPH3/VPS74 family protein n=1 Tax=Actinoplanes sp. NPDC051494 TaxID=3363907 RepID=UPI0037AD4913
MTMALRETLFLLAHRPSGRPRLPRFVLEFGLAAAALMELRRLGRIEVTGDGLVAVRSPSATGDPLLDRLLHQLSDGTPRPPHQVLPACGADVRQSVMAALAAHGHCRLDPAGHVVAVTSDGHRDDARSAVQHDGVVSDLGALLWATELSGAVLGRAVLGRAGVATRLRLGRQAAKDPIALAVRQAAPVPATALRFNGGAPYY